MNAGHHRPLTEGNTVLQLRLPMPYQCCNPLCKDAAQRNHFFCSDACYWQVERSIGHPSIFKKEVRHEDAAR